MKPKPLDICRVYMRKYMYMLYVNVFLRDHADRKNQSKSDQCLSSCEVFSCDQHSNLFHGNHLDVSQGAKREMHLLPKGSQNLANLFLFFSSWNKMLVRGFFILLLMDRPLNRLFKDLDANLMEAHVDHS